MSDLPLDQKQGCIGFDVVKLLIEFVGDASVLRLRINAKSGPVFSEDFLFQCTDGRTLRFLRTGSQPEQDRSRQFAPSSSYRKSRLAKQPGFDYCLAVGSDPVEIPLPIPVGRI